jgi:hypothetical protein
MRGTMRVGFWIWSALFFHILQGYATPISPSIGKNTPMGAILSFLDPQRKDLVSLEMKVPCQEGSVLYVYRFAPASPHIPIETGKIKILRMTGDVLVAEVLEDGSPLSRKVFPQFPGIMAEDSVTLPNLTLERAQRVLAENTFLYRDLFLAPSAQEQNYELSPAGKLALREFAAQLGRGYFSQLLVEGFTDESGNWGDNQVESYQRALAVRSFLVEELKFDSVRVLAVGHGEAGLSDTSHVAGHSERNRSIVLKVITPPESDL